MFDLSHRRRGNDMLIILVIILCLCGGTGFSSVTTD